MKTAAIIVVLNLIQITAFGQTNSTTKNLRKMENEKIIASVTNVFNGADEHNWQKIQNAMAGNVLLDYTSMTGGNPTIQTPKQIIDAWSSFLPGFDKTKHNLSNFQITIDNEIANVHYLGKAEHFIKNEKWTVEGSYDTELKKVNNVWVITKHKFNLEKQSGNINLPQKAIQIINNKKIRTMENQVSKEKVQFISDGLVLVGNLYKPKNFNSALKYGAVITGGSLTSVKEQMAGTYAEKLAEKGLIALAFDYRNYGESEGMPRQFEDPNLKLKDLEAATTYLLSLPYVNAVGALGVCTSAGNIAYLAADDKRVKAFATVAAWLPDNSVLPLLYGSAENVAELRKIGADAKREFATTGENKIIVAYHNSDKTASHVGPMEYYMDKTRGGGVKEWKNEFAVMSWESWLDFDPMSKAEKITTPFMMFHSDGSALPDNAKKFYDNLKGEKELVWGDGYHFDYYDQTKQVDAAIEKVSQFFVNNLN